MMRVDCYTIDEIDAPDGIVYDVYVSEDEGYTWEYYASYRSYAIAVEEAELAMVEAKYNV
jgi:hypothetical protein